MLLQGPHHLAGQGLQGPGRLVAHGDGKAAPLAGELPGLGPLACEGGQVQGGGHHQQAQVRRQHRARFPHQGQGQIGFAAALVEFIKDHAGHALEGGIGLQAAQEEAIGHHLDAGGGRAALFKAHPIAHLATNRFGQAGGQPLGGGLGRQAPGFEHQDCAGMAAPGLQQGQRHPGGFAGARRGLQQQGSARGQRRHNRVQAGLNRQLGHQKRAFGRQGTGPAPAIADGRGDGPAPGSVPA